MPILLKNTTLSIKKQKQK